MATLCSALRIWTLPRRTSSCGDPLRSRVCTRSPSMARRRLHSPTWCAFSRRRQGCTRGRERGRGGDLLASEEDSLLKDYARAAHTQGTKCLPTVLSVLCVSRSDMSMPTERKCTCVTLPIGRWPLATQHAGDEVSNGRLPLAERQGDKCPPRSEFGNNGRRGRQMKRETHRGRCGVLLSWDRGDGALAWLCISLHGEPRWPHGSACGNSESCAVTAWGVTRGLTTRKNTGSHDLFRVTRSLEAWRCPVLPGRYGMVASSGLSAWANREANALQQQQ